MTIHENFEAIKHHLSDLGYHSPKLDNDLREQLAAGREDFAFHHREVEGPFSLHCFFSILQDKPGEPFQLDHYDALLIKNDDAILGSLTFDGDVRRDEARQTLLKRYCTRHWNPKTPIGA